MKAITIYSLLLVVFFSVSSCKKENLTKSKTDLLTSKTWIYDEYLINYNQANTILAYKLGKPNYTMNLSLNKVKYNADGTYQETTENGTILTGTWKFINNETQTEVKNANGTFTSNLIVLTETNYNWYDPSVGRYGKMIPQ
jgi:hypothetical protein